MARAKEFDTEKAIDQAMEIFWQYGFNRSSLSQLTKATGLHKGSLYAAFKSKEHLFQICLKRYMNKAANDFHSSHLGPREYLKTFFLKKLNCAPKRKKRGCLLMNSSLEFAHDTKEKKKLNALLDGVQKNLKSALVKGQELGEFSQEMDPDKWAERLLALAFTIENMGKLGKDKTFLVNITNGTLNALNIDV